MSNVNNYRCFIKTLLLLHEKKKKIFDEIYQNLLFVKTLNTKNYIFLVMEFRMCIHIVILNI